QHALRLVVGRPGGGPGDRGAGAGGGPAAVAGRFAGRHLLRLITPPRRGCRGGDYGLSASAAARRRQRGPARAARPSSSASSAGPNAAATSLSTSNWPTTSVPSRMRTTISERVPTEQAR